MSVSPVLPRPTLPNSPSAPPPFPPAPLPPESRCPAEGLFITGTDTGVGKTTVATGLLRLLARRGRRPLPFKPAETGVTDEPLDALSLRHAANRPDLPLDLVCPHRFRPAVAPAAAAQSEGRIISLSDILSAAARLRDAGDYLVAESAGGLLTPYSDCLTAADLAVALRLSVLIVARNGLGTINHTSLTLNELRRRALPLAGVILVDTTPNPSPDRPSNARLIELTTGIKPLGVLPHLPNPTPDALADAIEALLPKTLL